MRLKTRAEKQAERGMATPARYNRAFARRQWRKSFADVFKYRKANLPSFPNFNTFVRAVLPDPAHKFGSYS